MDFETTSKAFNDRFRAYVRIEPRCRQDDIGKGIQARIADPLWLLARQWQMGEFLAQDAGSPIGVEMGYSTQAVDTLKLGDDHPKAAPAGIPMEVMVEQERGQLDYRERVRVGQEFERRLSAALKASGRSDLREELITALRAQDAYGFPMATKEDLQELDRASQRFVRFMTRRVIDGKAVLAGPLTISTSLPLPPEELEAVRDGLKRWYSNVCHRPASKVPPAWQPEKLDYGFEANTHPLRQVPALIPREDPTLIPRADPKTRLVAPDYRNGEIDWYTFSAGPEGARGSWKAPEDNRLDPVVTTPTRIQVAGTSPRWWAFEDGSTNFGALDVAKPDLAKLLMMDFVFISGDDWFSVPAPVALGSLVRVDRLRVKNVFGEVTTVGPARRVYQKGADWVHETDPNYRAEVLPNGERFDMFSLSGPSLSDPGLDVRMISEYNAPVQWSALARSTSRVSPEPISRSEPRPVLFVPPVTGFRQESDPVDEVVFLRDEGANMLWGVERTVPNDLGRPVAGFEAQLEHMERAREQLQKELKLLERRLDLGAASEVDRVDLEAEVAGLKRQISILSPHARPTPSQDAVPRYRLASTVPANWIPFIPVRKGAFTTYGKTAIQFRRAKMLRSGDGDELADVPSMSRLLTLDDHALLFINEEAIPRAGLRVQLTKQRVRWVDGSTHVWLGRKVLTGRGEGSSGLKFDTMFGLKS